MVGYNRQFKKLVSHEYTLKMALRRLHLHSKISIITTLCLIFGGAVFIFVLEYDNTATIGNMGFLAK